MRCAFLIQANAEKKQGGGAKYQGDNRDESLFVHGERSFPAWLNPYPLDPDITA